MISKCNKLAQKKHKTRCHLMVKLLLFLSASSIARHNGSKWILWFVFLTDVPLHSPRYCVSSSLFFASTLCQTGGLQETKKSLLLALLLQCNFFLSRQKRDRCPINSSSKNGRDFFFLPLALYTQHTSNWGKSFLFISPLYTPDKIWLSFCRNTVDLQFRGSILVQRHKRWSTGNCTRD